MKKIILKFIGTGLKNKYQACVNIYDTYNNLIYTGNTYDGKIIISLKEKSIYKLIATSCNDTIKVNLYVNKDRNEYTFWFNRSIFASSLKTITFHLNDANYDNLPIGKGEIILWQKQ